MDTQEAHRDYHSTTDSEIEDGSEDFEFDDLFENASEGWLYIN